MFIVKNCWGPSPLRCALVSLGQSVARANLRGQHPLRAEIWSSEKVNFVVSEPKFTGFFSPNARGIGIDTLVFRFWICRSVPETFAVEV